MSGALCHSVASVRIAQGGTSGLAGVGKIRAIGDLYLVRGCGQNARWHRGSESYLLMDGCASAFRDTCRLT